MWSGATATFRRGVLRQLRFGVGRVTLVLWFVVMTVFSAGMLARHLLAMPAPSKTSRLGHHLSTLQRPGAPHSWLAVHVLSSECACSQRVVAHLLATPRPAGWSEIVLWVGGNDPSSELTRRFDVRRVTAADLASYEIEAAPLLVVVSPDGDVRYAGGYTDRKQGPVFHDLEILDAARRAVDLPALPLFGCATSERLRTALAKLPTP
jgi:hypothetical protein